MGVTSRLALPYPELADRAIVPDDVRDLALAVDRAAIIDQGSLANRPVSSAASPGVRGRFYWATDQSVLYHDDGTGWWAINPQLVTDGPAGTGSLRTLGTSGTSAAAGNDVRLSDQRTPRYDSVTLAMAAPDLRPSQGAGGGWEALRAIGTGAGQVVGGNDGRLTNARAPLSHGHVIGDTTSLQTNLDGKVGTGDGRLTNQRVPTDGSVNWAKTGVGTAGLADQAFGLYRGTDYMAVAGSQVSFDTTIYLNGASRDASGLFTCTRAGLYEFTARVTVNNTGTMALLRIGGVVMDKVTTNDLLHAARVMAVGDTAYVQLTDGGPVAGGLHLTHFNGRMIGR